MKTKQLNTSKFLRFRRWSRVGYAVFCSLACSVSIGVLVISISNKAEIKSGIHVIETKFSVLSDNAPSDDDIEQCAQIIDSKQLNLITKQLTDNAAAYCQHTNIHLKRLK